MQRHQPHRSRPPPPRRPPPAGRHPAGRHPAGHAYVEPVGRLTLGSSAVDLVQRAVDVIDPVADAEQAAPAAKVPLHGAVIESHRMGASLVAAKDISPDAVPSCGPEGPYPTGPGVDASTFGAGTSAPLFDAAGYAGGWISCLTTGTGDLAGLVGILEVADAAHAKALVLSLALRELSPNAKAITVPGPAGATTVRFVADGTEQAAGFLIDGPMISYSFVGADKAGASQLPAAEALMARTLELRGASTAKFRPTPPGKLATLTDDPRGLARQVAQPPGDVTFYQGGYPPATTTPSPSTRSRRRRYCGPMNSPRCTARKPSPRSAGSACRCTSSATPMPPRPITAPSSYRAIVPIAKSQPGSKLTPVTLPHSKNVSCYAITFTEANINEECVLASTRYAIVGDLLGEIPSLQQTKAMTFVIGRQLDKTPRSPDETLGGH